VKCDGAAGPEAVADVDETGVAHHARQRIRAGEFLDGSGEIGIGGGPSGNCRAHLRQDVPKIKAKERAEQSAARLGTFQDSQFSAGPKEPEEFAETGGVAGQIAEAEGKGDQMEAAGSDGEIQGVGFQPGDFVRSRRSRNAAFFDGPDEHRMREIAAKHCSARAA